MDRLKPARDFVSGTIRAEKARRNVTFAQLSDSLRKAGIDQSATNLSTKVARGTMSAALFLALLRVMEQGHLELSALRLPPLRGQTKLTNRSRM